MKSRSFDPFFTMEIGLERGVLVRIHRACMWCSFVKKAIREGDDQNMAYRLPGEA